MDKTTAAPAPTPEQLKKQTEDLYASMGWGKPPEEAKPADAVAPATPEAKPEAAATTPVETPTAVAPAQPAAAPATDVRAVASAAAKIVMAELPRAAAPPAAPQQASPSADLSDLTKDDRKDYEVVEFLERETPKKFSGKSKAYLEFVRANYKYQDEWLEKNPGRDFNPDDSEHTAWYDKHPAPVSPDEIDSARERMIEERVYINRVKPEIDRINAEKALQQAMPEVAATVNRNLYSLIKRVSPTIAEIVKDANGNPDFSQAKREMADNADPIAFSILATMLTQEVEPMLVALEFSSIPEARRPIDPKKGWAHAEIMRFAGMADNHFSKPENSTKNGRQFISMREFERAVNAVPESEREAKANEIEATRWTISIDDITEFIISHYEKRMKSAIDESDNLAQRKYKPAATPVSATAVAAQPVIAAPTSKPKPPTTTDAGGSVQNTHLHNPPQKSFADQMAETHFRK